MIDLRVMPDAGEPYDLTVTTRDIAKWERTVKGASMAGLVQNMRADDLYKVGHNAATRTGKFTGTVQEFTDSCDLDVIGDSEADPTPSAA